MTFNIDWDHIGSDGSQTLTQNGQSVNVTVSTPQNGQGKEWFVENGMLKNWDVTTDSSADIRFDQEVTDVKFTLLDVDRLDEITIMTMDADGNPVPVAFEVTGVHHVNGNTVTGTQTNAPGPGPDNSGQDIEVCIQGPIKSFWIVLDDGPERDYSGTVAVSDITFELAPQGDGYVDGTAGNDVINAHYVGDPEGDKIDNNDELLPGAGPQDDVVIAGAGEDFVIAGDGSDEIYGGDDDDTLCGNDGDDTIYGGNGNDIIEGMNDNDLLFGQDGNDTIYGDGGNDVAVGGLGDDKIYGGSGDDVAHGGKGDDTIRMGSGDDLAYGGAGSDNIKGGTGDDTLIGGGRSFDGTIDFNDLDAGDLVDGQYLANGVHIYSADPRHPVMIFDSANPTGGDHDLATNNLGNVLILSEDRDSSDPDDNYDGGRGTFVFEFDGPAQVNSLDFLDIEGGAWIKMYDMNGNLIRQVDTGTTANNGQLHQAINQGGVVRMEVIIQGSGAIDNLSYTLDGEALDTGDTIMGEDGNDYIDGQAGDDELFGGAGNDRLIGGDGDDSMYGGDDRDVILGGAGDDIADGGAGDDEIWMGSGDDVAVGGAGNDWMHGQAGNDSLEGNDGDDMLFGEAGDDVLNGGAGNDLLSGGDDRDTLIAGAGDTADGGTGGDDYDILDLTAQGPFIIENETVDADGDSTSGTIVFVNPDGTPTGETLTFTEIEEIRGDQYNQGPVAGDDAFNAGEDDDAATVGNVLGNDTDPDGDDADLVVGAVNGDAGNVGAPVDGSNGGTVTINADGSVTFDPDGDFESLGNGETAETTVTYTVVDPDGAESTATVTFTVTGVNDGPVAVDSAYTVTQDEAAGDTDGNAITDDTGEGADSDPEDDPLTVVGVGDSAGNVGQVVAGSNGGEFTINANGTIDFNANGDFDGLGAGETDTTSISYTIADPEGEESTATVTFTINGTNDVPIACPDLYIVTEDETGGDVDGNVITNPSDNGAGLDIDPDGDTLTVVGVNTPNGNVGTAVAGANGGLFTINADGSFDFSANGEFEYLAPGESEETSVTYTVDDGNGGTATTTLTIRIDGVNDGPTAVADTDTTDQGTVIDLDNVLGNDTDPENDPLTVSQVNGSDANVGAAVAGDNGGLITINDDGTASFDPNGEFAALGDGDTAETSVTYTIVDAEGEESTTTVTITVTGTNDGPTAVADTGTTNEDTPTDLGNVLTNDTDPDGDTLTVAAVGGDPANVGTPTDGTNGGAFTINEDGTASFDPDGDFESLGDGETAETTITYTVTDPDGGESTTTVTVTVTGVNDAPNAVDSSYTVAQDEAFGDDDGDAITDDTGEGVDSDPEDDTLTVVAVGGSDANVGGVVAGNNGGQFTIGADGSIDFNANGEFDNLGEGETAQTTVSYTIADEDGLESTANVTFTVTGTNDGPVAVEDAFDAGEDDAPAVVGNVLTNDTDPDNTTDELAVSEVNGLPANVGTPVAGDNGGLITIGPDGEVTFDPNGDFEALGEGEEATTTVEYTVTDPDGAESTTTVTFTVTGVNDGPDAIDNAYVVSLSEEGGDTDGNVLTDDTGDGVDSDPENDELTVVGVGVAAGNVGTPVAGDTGGTFTISANGDVDFDANGDFDDLGLGETRDTTVEYTISDGNGGTDTATATFTVTGINDGTVQGTDGADVINPDIPYVDADGDIVDGNDAILPGDTGNDDLIYGFDGDDLIDAGDGNDEVYGGNDDDSISGNAGDDTIFGDDGDDTINGNQGNDTLFGGEGDDIANGGFGDDVIKGGAGNDELNGQSGNDDIMGEAGDDILNGGSGDDVLDGGIGNDTLEGSDGDDTLIGGAGDDDLWGGLDDDLVDGGDGDDTVAGEDGDDTLFGGAGNDTVLGADGNDIADGGDGDDIIDTSNGNDDAAPDVGYPFQPGTVTPDNPLGLPFPGYAADDDPDDDKDTVFGGAGNDIITTGDDDDTIFGGSGNDQIFAGFDDDTVDGGTGNDTIVGSEGNDVVEGGEGDDLIYGGLDDSFPETVNFPDDEPGDLGFQDLVPDNNNDTLFGGAGNDTIFGKDDDDTLFGGTGNDVLDGGIDDDEIYGDEGDDTLLGGQGNDVMDGGVGDDSLNGGDGDDTLIGGAGNDMITGSVGIDTIFGGDGDDSVSGGFGDDPDEVYGGAGNDIVHGGFGDDTLFGGDGDDTISSNQGDDTIFGGEGDDSIQGGTGTDTIEGGDGNDLINANTGDDSVDAGAGDDRIVGGEGDDLIFAGDGNDTIFGGEGEDDLFGGFGDDGFFGGNGGDNVVGGEDPDDGDIDVLDLTGSNVDYIEYVDGDPEAGTVFFLDGTTMTFSEIENVIPCFTPGTTIATPKGERLVEELQVGDRIITRDNGIQEIAWMGHKEMSGKQLVQNAHLRPILIKAGALGHGLPERDMMVSPNHRVLVASDKTQLYFEESEVLAAAKHMVGAEGIHAVDVVNTTYIHFMFERHEVVLSNGAWTESFQPGDYSLKGIGNSQRNEIMELFPELATKTGLEGYQSARKALKKHEAKLLLK